jgi:hypothetical protein
MSELSRADVLELEAKELRQYPFFPRPARVKILMVTDGGGSFDRVAAFGLGTAIDALMADPWWWVRFDITTAHRGTGAPGSAASTAQHQSFRFDDPPAGVSLGDFHEVWLFGVLPDGAVPALGPGERAALAAFMEEGGGVFATGDHESLGACLCSEVPRVRKMRRWKAGGPAGAPPPQFGPDRHDTTREGSTPGYQFDDQSDEVPQKIRPRMYAAWSPFPWRQSLIPHPVLCGRNGVIDVLPDHMHEGEVIEPASVAGDREFPGGIAPEIIASATVIPHTSADGHGPVNGKSFGVLGAYNGHLAGIGRIVVDATWHHWFNINLIGFAPGSPAIEKIENYFWNVALWLAPPSRQQAMFDRAVYGLPHIGPFRELSPDLPIAALGAIALDVLGRRTSQCAVHQWVQERLPLELRPWFRFPTAADPSEPPARGLYHGSEFLIGGIAREMMKLGSGLNPPSVPHDERIIARAVDLGLVVGLKSLVQFEYASARYMEGLLKACQQQIARFIVD